MDNTFSKPLQNPPHWGLKQAVLSCSRVRQGLISTILYIKFVDYVVKMAFDHILPTWQGAIYNMGPGRPVASPLMQDGHQSEMRLLPGLPNKPDNVQYTCTLEKCHCHQWCVHPIAIKYCVYWKYKCTVIGLE